MIRNTTETASGASKTGGFVFTYQLKSDEEGGFPKATNAAGLLRFLANAIEEMELKNRDERCATSAWVAHLNRRIASLKGVITHMKRRATAEKIRRGE